MKLTLIEKKNVCRRQGLPPSSFRQIFGKERRVIGKERIFRVGIEEWRYGNQGLSGREEAAGHTGKPVSVVL